MHDRLDGWQLLRGRVQILNLRLSNVMTAHEPVELWLCSFRGWAMEFGDYKQGR